MNNGQIPYWELLTELDSADSGRLERNVERWLSANAPERKWLTKMQQTNGKSIPPMPIEEIWRLYALSRVADALITRMAKDSGCTRAYAKFMEGNGLSTIVADRFHPFFHEIVAVVASEDNDAPITVTNIIWPGFMCGSLLIARAGVSVSGGTNNITKDIAENSTLYWCYRRANRPTEDLSLGWGHNSQWRTGFRRDYFVDGQFHYNVDGKPALDDSELSQSQQVELLRHRCFVTTSRPHADLWPYAIRHCEAAP